MTIAYRRAVPEDAHACLVLRGMTRENAFSVERLAEAGVTLESWRAAIADGSLPGHVATADGEIAGYCFGERETGEVVVLALLPEHEGRAYEAAAVRTLQSLYRNYGTWGNPGHEAILTQGTGHKPAGQNVNVSLIYGDYFFAEAYAKRNGWKSRIF